MLFSPREIQETVDMFMRHKLDVRAITMGVSLRDCASPSGEESRRRIRDKLLRTAGRLVSVGRDIEAEFGVPIINKRISVTPHLACRRAERRDRLYPVGEDPRRGRQRARGRLCRRVLGARAEGHDLGGPPAHRINPARARRDRPRVLVDQSRDHEERH